MAAADIGLAFQIQDDVLDVTSTMEVLGKPIGSDEKEQQGDLRHAVKGWIKRTQDVERDFRSRAVERADNLPGKKYIPGAAVCISLIQQRKIEVRLMACSWKK